MSSTTDEIMKRDKVSREAHARLWEENIRLRRELLDATMIIQKLTNRPLGTNAVVQTTTLNVPGSGKQPVIIGIVRCPSCGQMMEVEK